MRMRILYLANIYETFLKDLHTYCRFKQIFRYFYHYKTIIFPRLVGIGIVKFNVRQMINGNMEMESAIWETSSQFYYRSQAIEAFAVFPYIIYVYKQETRAYI
jgi:hypothetical protein